MSERMRPALDDFVGTRFAFAALLLRKRSAENGAGRKDHHAQHGANSQIVSHFSLLLEKCCWPADFRKDSNSTSIRQKCLELLSRFYIDLRSSVHINIHTERTPFGDVRRVLAVDIYCQELRFSFPE
jgi:hypothetical protein